jgi:putative hydrolase of the HAD superfamily
MTESRFDAIIFDFGGVLLDLSYEATTEALQELCAEPIAYSQMKQATFFDQYERGDLTSDEFRQQIRALIQGEARDDQIDAAWNRMLGGLPEERIALLTELRQSFRLFLLSNTNEIHKRAFDQTLDQVMGLEAFKELFEETYYSHLIRCRKPEAMVYRMILKTHGLDPRRTLFIDDNSQNVDGANAVGIRGIHLTGDLCDWYAGEGRQLLVRLR